MLGSREAVKSCQWLEYVNDHVIRYSLELSAMPVMWSAGGRTDVRDKEGT